MTIDTLMHTQTICEIVEKNQMENLLTILEHLNCFDMEYLFDEKNIAKLYELLMCNRRKEACKEFSIFLDRNRAGSVKRIDQKLFEAQNEKMQNMMKDESNDIKAILYHQAPFHREEHLLTIGKAEALRMIASEEDLYRVLTVLGLDIDDLHEFSEYIRNVYQTIYFDSNIENSMKKLTAGFIVRRHEILYHLYCIHKEIPEITEMHGLLANQSMGDKMSIRCSPEKDRNIVANLLTKEADNDKKIKCELHTKMETIGSQKPDRIYFCASVPKGISLNGEDLSGRIYVYKITKHT